MRCPPRRLAAAAGGLLGRLSYPESRLPPRQWRQDGAHPPRALNRGRLKCQGLKGGRHIPRFPIIVMETCGLSHGNLGTGGYPILRQVQVVLFLCFVQGAFSCGGLGDSCPGLGILVCSCWFWQQISIGVSIREYQRPLEDPINIHYIPMHLSSVGWSWLSWTVGK